jgi:hypothetical protein
MLSSSSRERVNDDDDLSISISSSPPAFLLLHHPIFLKKKMTTMIIKEGPAQVIAQKTWIRKDWTSFLAENFLIALPHHSNKCRSFSKKDVSSFNMFFKNQSV